MVALERGTRSSLTGADLKLLKQINTGLTFYSGYYERLTWFNSDVDYKEYLTLKLDFNDFYQEVSQFPFTVDLYILNSFVSSFRQLFHRVHSIFPQSDSMFMEYLTSSVVCISVIITELLDPEK